MTAPVPFEGGCACGAVRYRCAAAPFVSYACHCTACQKRTGSAFGVSVQVPAEAVTLIAGAPRSRVRIADSGNELRAYFCGDCGTTVFSDSSARPRIRTLTAGGIDDPSWVPLQANIWTRSALPWMHLSEAIDNYAKAGDWTAYYASDPSRLTP